jgi:hypothetical protein
MKTKIMAVLTAVMASIGWQAGAQTYTWTTIAGLTNTPAYADGTNYAAFFNSPQGLAVDGAGNVFVADANNRVIRKISPIGSNWVTTTIAGFAGSQAFTDGTNSAARFYNITTLKIDGAGNLYVTDYNSSTGYYWIRKIAPVGTNWVVTTIYHLSNSTSGWAIDPSGNYYTASNYAIIQLSPVVINGVPAATNFVATILAGFPGIQGYADGYFNVARFYSPSVFAVDSSGTVYLTDFNNSVGHGSFRVVNLGNQVASIDYNQGPTYCTLDSSGNIFGSHYYYFYNPGYTYGLYELPPGAVVATWGGTSIPTGVAVGSDGTVYLADSGTSVIMEGISSVPNGSLQVTLQDSNAVSAGAAWRVDAGLWQTNGATVTNLMAGSNHVLSFTPVFGWASPSNQWVTISNNATTSVTGTYIQQFGALQVNLTPPVATNAGAEWQLDGGTWQTSGTIISNLVIGTHTVSFTNVAGYITPAALTNINIAWNQTTVATGNYVALGNVQVTIVPNSAVTNGAQWQIDGGAFQNSGTTLSNLTLGAHTIAYSAVNGFFFPAYQVVTVVSGQTTNVTGIYVPTGTVQVFITPIGAVSAGALWRLDNSTYWNGSGMSVMGVLATNHTISFTNIAGWTTPTNQTVMVNLNQTTVATGIYVQQFGNLQVVLSPAGAVSEGAQWQVDAGAWQASGATLTNVTVGSHTVAYASLAGWTAPTNQTVTISSNQTTRLTAIYQGQGLLQVLLVPTGAIVSGAQWQVDGDAWMSNGMVVSGLSRGTHTVAYKSASGWVAPANQSVSILANQTTVTNGLYTGLGYSFTTIAGTVGDSAFADGTNYAALFYTPVGICADLNSNLYIADTGNSVIRKLTPTTNGWVSSTIAGLAGYPGNADGTNNQARFDYPSGVTVDTNGNLFVADQVNSIVRKMTTDGTNWTVSTIAGLAGNYGSANGTNGAARFYYPAGVTVDTAGNVYVADQINSTIRKLTPLGSNNWAVATIAGTNGVNGSADGTNNTSRFYWPSDLTVDASGNLFVADTFNNTIRKVSPVGTNYVTTTICGVAGVNNSVDGTNNTALFDGLGGIALDAFGNLFVADSYSSVIRKITPVGNNWVVNTVGGLAYVTGATDGTNSAARFDTPYGVCVDGNGVVYVADTYNQTIRAGSTLFPLPAKPSIAIAPAGKNFSFNWQAQAGLTYQVQFKTNLVQAVWLDLGSSILATNTTMPFVDTSATNDQRFYRVKVLP